MADSNKLILCPYCGNTQSTPEDRCAACGGFFDSLSLKVTQQHMGPWFVRDRNHPFRPGCTYEVLAREIEKGKIKPTTIIRGPTTRQFWSVARNVAGVAHLLGYCHACGGHVRPGDDRCAECGEAFHAPRQRDQLGLAPVGADVQAVPQLSETGAYQTVGSTVQAAGSPATTPGGYAAGGSPGGSSILAGLRSESADAPVEAATARATAARDAMAWMTSTGSEEPDTLATAGDAAGPARRYRHTGATNAWTWVLILVNVVLFAAAIAAVVIVVGQSLTAGPSDGKPTQRPGARDDGGDGAPSTPQTGGDGADATDAGRDDFQPPDFADAGEPEAFQASPANAPNRPDPTAAPNAAHQPPQDDPNAKADTGDPPPPEIVWAERFDRALALEDDGQLEEARDLLQQIKTDAPTHARPANLNKAIERVATKLNRRNVQDFFGP